MIIYEYMFMYKHCGCEPEEIQTRISKQNIFALVEYLKLASVPSRLSLLLLLNQKPHCVCDLMAHTKMSQTLISHHLSDLTKAKLVQSQKRGQFMDYRLTIKGKNLIDLLKKIKL